MKYQCEKEHLFSHPAKLTIGSIPHTQLDLLNSLIEEGLKDKTPEIAPIVEIFQTITKVMGEGTFEKFVCPECRTHNFKEYDEPQLDIVSMKSVDINQVDDYLTQGYKVKESSTTKACIVKYAEVAPVDANPNTGETLTELISNVNKNTEAP